MRENAKVLIIDDEEDVRKILSLFFQKHGCQVYNAQDGQDGIEKVRQERFDLIFLDLNMPRMSGMEALPIIRTLNPDARVVIMTGFGSYESKVEAREQGAYDYFLKPISISKIKEVADRALPDRRQSGTGTSEGITKVRLSLEHVDPEIVQTIPEKIARVFCMIPIAKEADLLTVAMVDPFDLVALDSLNAQTGYRIRPVQADREEIVQAIEAAYKKLRDINQTQLDPVAVQSVEPAPEVSEDRVEVATNDAALVPWMNWILLQAVQNRANGIHIEPGVKSVSVRLRINGAMHEIIPPPLNLFPPLISRIKALANMDVAEHRIPQDGRARMKLQNRALNLRITIMPTIRGESAVIHLMDEEILVTDIKKLGLDDHSLKIFLDAIQRPHGMIYLTGPTGSGKTTTLYSALNYLNSRERKIMTVEEPVEYEMEGINQVHVRSDIGLTFASALRAILRQDPDVVMVGETRDLETAEIAIRAALTGHLVFSTLHTNDAPSSVTRLVDLGIQPFLVSTALNLIVAQRLVRRICTECKVETKPSEELVERAVTFGRMTIPETLYAGAGCPNCNKTGYRGRLGIHELLPVTGRVKQVIMKAEGEERLREEMTALDCHTLMQNGLVKATQGLTTLDEVVKATISG